MSPGISVSKICVPFGGGISWETYWTTQYQAVMDAMPTRPNDTDRILQAKLMKELVDGGYLAKAELIDIFCADTSANSLLNWRDPTGLHNPSLVNAPSFTAYEGFTGAAAGSKYVRLNFNLSTDGTIIGQDNVCAIVGYGTDVESASYDFGSLNAATSYFLLQASAGGVVNYFCNEKTSGTNTNADGACHLSMSRSAGANYKRGLNAVLTATAVASVAVSDKELYVCAMNNNGTANVSNTQVRYVFIFSSLTDNEVRDVISIMEEYYDAYSKRVIDHTFAYPVNSSKVLLDIPTSVVGNNEVIHPAVVNVGAVWNGYQYWMACTPYPTGDNTYEVPEIFASSDGINWVVPAGGANPILPHPVANTYSDVDLYYESGTLYLFYRSTQTGVSEIRLLKSTDGITWNTGSPQVLHNQTVAGYLIGSTSLVKIAGVYYMYCETNDVTYNPWRVIRVSCNTIDGTYANPEAIVAAYTLVSNHLMCKEIGGKYYLVTGESIAGNFQVQLRRSDDGVNFTNEGANYPLIYKTKSWETAAQIYKRPFLCYVGSKLMCYYSLEDATAATYIAVQEIKLV
jgi:hypothetical protein